MKLKVIHGTFDHGNIFPYGNLIECESLRKKWGTIYDEIDTV